MKTTIDKILQACFESVKAIYLKDRAWKNYYMQEAHDADRVRLMPLGAQVEVYQEDGSIKTYDVEEIIVPMTWNRADDLKYDENGRIALVKALIENAMDSMEFLIHEKLGATKRAIVSQNYRHVLGPTQKLDKDTYRCVLVTVVAFID